MRVPHFLPTPAETITQVVIPEGPLAMPFPISGEYKETIDAAASLSWQPLQMTVNKGVEWYWRVKSWDLTIEGTGVDGFPSQTITLDHQEGTPVATELDLCDWFNRIGGHLWAYASGGGMFTASIGAGTLNVTPRLYYLGQGFVDLKAYQMTRCDSPATALFLPTMGLYIELVWNDGVSIDGIYIGTSYDSGATADHDTTLTMDGESFAFRWTMFSGDDFGTITVSLTPSAYWEYRDADGNNPIWDSATGAQLRSVVTGETI